MQYAAGLRRTATALAAAAAATALMTGCGPAGDSGAAAQASSPPAASGAAQATPAGGGTGGTGGSGASGGSGGSSAAGGGTGGGSAKPTSSAPGSGGKAKACTIEDVQVSPAHQADVRPPGTGTGAVVVSVTSRSNCTLNGFPQVAGAGNGSPDKNLPLATTNSGTAAPVSLTPGARAWTKLTFVNVQGEADGYCVSGSTPVVFPTLVIRVPGAGSHQIAMDDGQFAECDNKVTVTPFSLTKPS
ncbi:uncharacterized protein DUF4232 [Streptomyces sp. 3211.6]|uniref:DUF4232 domain-containing protein n=1 Tax=unclassified Streptomyces TaxID=2593676 RepID=UPI000EB1A20F|nr:MULTISPECIES: DUF4232 domain-containing protein [unclassified Streptomyces]RKT08421.1 uncharacterized protein DUF4232 [Streptomyces sp. 3211.6]RPF29819.1 uncharacterized protein DUF4232 [Streptomyces sp. Ag109_G2-6]